MLLVVSLFCLEAESRLKPHCPSLVAAPGMGLPRISREGSKPPRRPSSFSPPGSILGQRPQPEHPGTAEELWEKRGRVRGAGSPGRTAGRGGGSSGCGAAAHSVKTAWRRVLVVSVTKRLGQSVCVSQYCAIERKSLIFMVGAACPRPRCPLGCRERCPSSVLQWL